MALLKNIPVLIFLVLSPVLYGQQEDQSEALAEIIEKYGQAEVTFAYPGYSGLTGIGRLISISSVVDDRVFAVLSSKDVDTFLSLGIKYKLIIPDETKSVESALSVQEAMNWDLYPTYPQYDTIMHKLAGDYPELCMIDTIGYSLEGRLILALKISDNVGEDEDEPEVFYTSTMHGDELQGYVLMLRFAEHLLENYQGGGQEEKLVDSLEIWINPLANPDGTYNGGDTITNPTRFNSAGTDLNRDFPDPMDPSIVPDHENMEMIGFMRERNFVLSANFHGGYEVVNFPWDRWLGKIPADSVWFYNISRKYADTVHNHSVETYMDSYNDGVVRGAVWYVIYGGRQDFVTYALQGREVTIELDITKETPAARLPLLWNYNYRSFLGYLENAFYGIHGKVIDDDTGEPVRAKVFIGGHDKDSSQVYSDTLSGSFIRMLDPGTWDLSFTAEGYYPVTVSGITLESAQQRFITVRLSDSATQVPRLPEEVLKIYPIPAGDHIFIDPGTITGQTVNIAIFDHMGNKETELHNIASGSDDIFIPVSHLAPGYYIIRLTDMQGRQHHASFVKN
ncbi:MAG: hypothetical protein K9J25_00535 [Bacteroidales bacterium]|nr:hypothetical protein [Bacteroidales bacterium]